MALDRQAEENFPWKSQAFPRWRTRRQPARLVLVPGYVVWSRRWRGFGLVVLHAVCWFALCNLSMIAGYLIM